MLLELFTDIDSSKPKFSFKIYNETDFPLPLVYKHLYYKLIVYTNIDSESNFIAYSKFRIYDYYDYTQSLIKTLSYFRITDETLRYYFRITDEKDNNYITNNSIF
jgi:hypothetical protein